jgi:hypothetical protein
MRQPAARRPARALGLNTLVRVINLDEERQEFVLLNPKNADDLATSSSTAARSSCPRAAHAGRARRDRRALRRAVLDRPEEQTDAHQRARP